MKYFTWAFIFSSFFNFYIANAQRSYSNDAVPIPNLVPPSPDAASLGKYGEIPIDKYNGLPNIDIPLYTGKSGPITVPISISYHASGIKVEERAPWVGLGWALNAGGMITRTIVGLPDEGNSNMVGYLNNHYDLENIGSLPADTQLYIANSQKAGLLDTEPDIYYFNFCGISGKFTINKTTHAVDIIPKRNLSVTFTSTLSSWTITDEKGFKYMFSGIERSLTQLNMVDTHSTNVITGWYLKSITSPENHKITFNYQTYSSVIHSLRSSQRKIFIAGDVENCPLNSTSYLQYFTSNQISGQRVSSIQFDNGLVKFIKSSTNRLDQTDDYSLDSVKVYDTKSKLIKAFKFNYDYYLENAESQGTRSGETLKRLKLSSIDELNPSQLSSTDKKSYTFDYNGTHLPYIFSYSQDHWGYYNGASNSMLVPNSNHVDYGGANRVSSASNMDIGVLQKITYPTGGSTEFNFEANEILITANNVANYFSPTDFAFGPSIPTVSYGVDVDGNTTTSTFQVDTATRDSVLLFTYNVLFPSQLNCDGSDKNCLGSFQVTLSKIAGNHPDQNTGRILTRHQIVNGMIRDTIYLTRGATYRLKMVGPVDMVQGSSASVYGHKTMYVYRSGGQYANMGVGGLRIASMINHPTIGTDETISYRYVDSLNYTSGNQYFSTGRIISYPKYDYLTQSNSVSSNLGGNYLYNCIADVVTSNSLAPLSNYSGETVGYKSVQEVHQSGNTKIKTVTEYSSSDDYPDNVSYSYPYLITESFPYKRGLEKTEKKYSFKNNTYYLVSQKDQEYTFPSSSYSYIPGLAIGSNTTSSIGSTTTTNSIFKNYKISTQQVYLSQTIQTQYDLNGSNPLKDTSYYYYDNPTHLQLTRTQSRKSNGKLFTSIITYPDDYAAGTTFIDNMKTNHLVGVPIEQTNYQTDASGSAVMSGTLTQFQTGGKGLTDKIYKFESVAPVSLSSFKFSDRATGQLPYGTTVAAYSKDSHFQPKLAYNSYDTVGNPLTITSVNGIANGYQWGYGNVYPVAKAVNATSNDIFYDSFEEGDGNGTLEDSKTGHYSHSGSYSKTLTGLDTGSYILSYWLKSGPAWSLQVLNKTVSSSSYTISLNAQVDDIRFYPAAAQMTTYTYDPLIGVTSITDVKGEVSYYEYDDFKRLMNIKDKDGNIVKHMDYHYIGQ